MAHAQQQTSVMSVKGQVVIPARVRTQMGLVEGDQVAFIPTDDGAAFIVERVLSREERRKQWMKKAFEGHAQSSVEKVWTELDGEAFVDG